MQPLVRAALAVGVLAAISGVAAERSAPSGGTSEVEAATEPEQGLARMPCGPRELPEGAACVPLPQPSASASAAPDDDAQADALAAFLPRRPDRPADLAALALPLLGELLPLPRAAGGGDVDASVLRIAAARGTPVAAAYLDGQDEPYEVLAEASLEGRGRAVAALASTKEGRRSARWLVLWGALDGVGPTVAPGAKLTAGQVVGFVGGEGSSPDGAHLRFEVRRLRASADARTTPIVRLVTDAESIATDARNVLPRR